MFLLKHHTFTKFEQIIDISAQDTPEKKYRYEVFYNVISYKYNQRLVVVTNLLEATSLSSVTNIFLGANWYERET